MATYIIPIAVNIGAMFVDIADDLAVTRLVSGIAGAVLVVTRAELVITPPKFVGTGPVLGNPVKFPVKSARRYLNSEAAGQVKLLTGTPTWNIFLPFSEMG